MFKYSPSATFFCIVFMAMGALFSIPPEVMQPYIQPILSFFSNLGIGGFYILMSGVIFIYIVVAYIGKNRTKVKG